MYFIHELRAHLYYKIIVPFLLLTLLVALVSSGLAFLVITGSAQERLNNQIAQVARALGDSVIRQESANLQFLREVAFAGANQASGAPAIADALAAGDSASLSKALDPYFRVSAQRAGVRIDRLIAFGANQGSLIDWERMPSVNGTTTRVDHPTRNLGDLWFVPRILGGAQDDRGDKYAGLLAMPDGEAPYLFTVVPVVKGERIVGGLIVATRLDTLLRELSTASQAAAVAIFQADNGSAFASTLVPVAGLSALNIRPDLVPQIRDEAATERRSFFDTVSINQRDYQFAYAPMRVRGVTIGLIAVALSSDYVVGPWSDARTPLISLTIALMLGIICVGLVVARRITRPLHDLVRTARAITAGDLQRRSRVQVSDEIGELSGAFNTMTGHLFDLYQRVRAESHQRAAIIESISDGVVVCAPDGQVQVMNRAMRAMLRLSDDEPPPQRFEAIPLRRLDTASNTFGNRRTSDLFELYDRPLRVAAAPVRDDDGQDLGVVCVLQDETETVAIDRAKTNFIATISHEIRTPLTVISGNMDLLRLDIVGAINEEQRSLIESTRRQVQSMATLLNSVIMIASIDSGSLETSIRPLRIQRLLNDVASKYDQPCTEKGLALIVEAPDLPAVSADESLVLKVLESLIDNACRYTEAGQVVLRASRQHDTVQVDVVDSGRGISPELRAHLFSRFSRGMGTREGINSAERGIGLGLPIALALIEQQRGKLWLAESSERGSIFSFTLPVAL